MILFLLLSTYVIAQPNMTVWKVYHKSDVPIFAHTPSDNAKLWDCGYEYYFFYAGAGVGEEIILHVLNDGNETLKLSAPALVNAGPEYTIDLLGLTGDIEIEPNQELQIIVNYTGPPLYSNSSAELKLLSNDPNSASCSFEFEVGIVLAPPVDPLVPTLSQWGIISLAILLLIFGITAIRERKAA